MGDHVKDNSQTVPTLGNSSPLCYTVSEMLQYPRCCINVLPGPQLQQQQQIREQPSPVFQQLVPEGPNVSDSSASTSNPSLSLATRS
ncbi:hypothetical protein MRX96_044097 [Rhipicephalus microplus]